MFLRIYKKMFIAQLRLAARGAKPVGSFLRHLGSASRELGIFCETVAPIYEGAIPIVADWTSWKDVISGDMTPEYRKVMDDIARDIAKELAKGDFFTCPLRSE